MTLGYEEKYKGIADYDCIDYAIAIPTAVGGSCLTTFDNTVRASSITFGNNIGAYYGYDYWGSISFDKVVEFLKRGVIIL